MQDTITIDELTAYYDRYGFGGAGSRIQAAAVFLDVSTHREPEYVDQGIYLDAYREVWQFFKPDPFGEWTKPVWNAVGDSKTYDFDVPRRPLTRLVPENGDMLCYLGHAITQVPGR